MCVPFRKRQPTVHDKPLKFLHDLSTIPIYCQSSKQLSTVQCVDILFDPELSSNSLCTRVPFDVHCNSVFVIDTSNLSDPKDVMCDDMGVWRWKGSYRRWLSVDEKGCVETIGKTLKKSSRYTLLSIAYGRGIMKINPTETLAKWSLLWKVSSWL